MGVGTKGRRINEHFVGEMQLGIEHKLDKDRVICPQNDFYKQEGEGQFFRTAHKGILLKVVVWIIELLPDFYSKNKNICPSNQYPLVNGTSHLRWKVISVPWTNGWANFFSKGPDSKHFGHSGLYNLHCRDSTQLLHCKSSH